MSDDWYCVLCGSTDRTKSIHPTIKHHIATDDCVVFLRKRIEDLEEKMKPKKLSTRSAYNAGWCTE